MIDLVLNLLSFDHTWPDFDSIRAVLVALGLIPARVLVALHKSGPDFGQLWPCFGQYVAILVDVDLTLAVVWPGFCTTSAKFGPETAKFYRFRTQA